MKGKCSVKDIINLKKKKIKKYYIEKKKNKMSYFKQNNWDLLKFKERNKCLTLKHSGNNNSFIK